MRYNLCHLSVNSLKLLCSLNENYHRQQVLFKRVDFHSYLIILGISKPRMQYSVEENNKFEIGRFPL